MLKDQIYLVRGCSPRSFRWKFDGNQEG